MDRANRTENRNSGHPGVDGGHLLEPEEARADPVEEHQGQQPVGGADRQQVEQDRQGGDDQGPEGEHEQHEAESEHEDQHVGGRGADGVEVVGGLGGLAARRRPCAAEPAKAAGIRCWRRSATAATSRPDTASPRMGTVRASTCAVGRGLDLAGPEARVAGQGRLQLGQVGAVGGAASDGDDLDRVGVLVGEVGGDGQVALLGGQRCRAGWRRRSGRCAGRAPVRRRGP